MPKNVLFVLSEEKEKFFMDNYLTKTRKEMAVAVGCTPRMVKRLASRYGIRKNNVTLLKVGDIFGNLKVVKEAFLLPVSNKNRNVSWVMCECLLCSRTYPIRVNSLRSGTKSCGCNQKELVFRKYDVNYRFFNTWTSEMAYVMGFITADGNIDRNTVRISLKNTDIEILEYIRNIIGYTGPIVDWNREYEYKGKKKILYQKRLVIASYKLVNKLKEYGIFSAKTGKETLPDIPDEYFYDYLKGVFDGDGCFSFQAYHRNKAIKYLRLSIACSNKEFLENIKKNIGLKGSIHKNGDVKCYSLVFGHYDSIEIGRRLYKNNGFALKRKKDRWLKAVTVSTLSLC